MTTRGICSCLLIVLCLTSSALAAEFKWEFITPEDSELHYISAGFVDTSTAYKYRKVVPYILYKLDPKAREFGLADLNGKPITEPVYSDMAIMAPGYLFPDGKARFVMYRYTDEKVQLRRPKERRKIRYPEVIKEDGTIVFRHPLTDQNLPNGGFISIRGLYPEGFEGQLSTDQPADGKTIRRISGAPFRDPEFWAVRYNGGRSNCPECFNAESTYFDYQGNKLNALPQRVQALQRIKEEFDTNSVSWYRENSVVKQNTGKKSKKGKIIYEAILTDAAGNSLSKRYSSIRSESNGYFPAILNGKGVGVIDTSGKEIIPPVYRSVRSPLKDNFFVVKNKKDGPWYVVNNENQKIAGPFQHVGVSEHTINLVKQNDKYGLMDNQGNTVVPIELENAQTPSPRAFGVQEGGKWYLKDFKLNTIAGPFDYFGSFHGEVAPFGEGGKIGFINDHGEILIKPEYDKIKKFYSDYTSKSRGRNVLAANTPAWQVIKIEKRLEKDGTYSEWKNDDYFITQNGVRVPNASLYKDEKGDWGFCNPWYSTNQGRLMQKEYAFTKPLFDDNPDRSTVRGLLVSTANGGPEFGLESVGFKGKARIVKYWFE